MGMFDFESIHRIRPRDRFCDARSKHDKRRTSLRFSKRFEDPCDSGFSNTNRIFDALKFCVIGTPTAHGDANVAGFTVFVRLPMGKIQSSRVIRPSRIDNERARFDKTEGVGIDLAHREGIAWIIRAAIFFRHVADPKHSTIG